jgi:hypothetical protein
MMSFPAVTAIVLKVMNSGLIILGLILASSLCAHLGSCLEGGKHRRSGQLRFLVVLPPLNSLFMAGLGAGHSLEMTVSIETAPLC